MKEIKKEKERYDTLKAQQDKAKAEELDEEKKELY